MPFPWKLGLLRLPVAPLSSCPHFRDIPLRLQIQPAVQTLLARFGEQDVGRRGSRSPIASAKAGLVPASRWWPPAPGPSSCSR